MKKMTSFLKSHKYFLLLVFFFIFLLPSTIASPSQTDTRSIVTGISIDKQNENFLVALQVISPQSNLSNNENLQIVEDEGQTFYDCIASLSIKLGKFIGFEHANIIIFGESLQGEDCMNVLDFLYRNYKITMSAILIQCKGNAKTLLETSAELNNNSSSSLQNNLGFNNLLIETANTTTLGNFFNDYFSFSGVSLMSVIETPKENENSENENEQGGGGNEQKQQDEQSSGGSQSGSEKAKVEPIVQNNGEGAVFKNGKFVEIISKDLTKGFTWPQEKTVQGIVKIDDMTDNKFFNHSTVNVKIENSTTKLKSEIKDDELILNVNLKLYCYVAEIIDINKKAIDISQLNENFLTLALKEKVKENIKTLVDKSLDYSKEKNLDIFKLYDRFYKYNYKEFRKFLSKFGEDYLNHTKINLNIEIFQYKWWNKKNNILKIKCC